MDSDPDVGRLRTALDELRFINTLLWRISQVRESNHVMSMLLDGLMHASGSDQGIVSLVKRMDRDELTTVARCTGGKSGGIPYQVDELVAGWVLIHKTQLKVDDLGADDRFAALGPDQGNIGAILCTPMMVRDDIIGLITLVRDRAAGPFKDETCRVAGILASQGGQVLANARLLEELVRANEQLRIDQDRLNTENARLRTEISGEFAFESIVGRSPAMKQVLILTSKFAANDSPILITGETGTGKDLIARAIHYNSARRQRPFVVKNCSIKTESLLESELFGHTKGAYTGADREKPGLFREADGGTIFLDEIGDAPLSTQAAILRVIESGEIRPVGSSKTEYVNVRVISATNKDLAAAMTSGEFRQDLFYRLNTFSIRIPALRERREDIPHLVHYFLGHLRKKLGRPELTVSAGAMDLLTRTEWPGNVRELEHALERGAVVCGADAVIDTDDFLQSLTSTVSGLESADKGALRDAVELLERNMIADALRAHHDNIVHTARALGLTRKGLKDKMTRYHMRHDET